MLEGALDLAAAPALGSAAEAVLRHPAGATVGLDLSAVTFLSAAGVGWLVALHAAAARRGIALRVAGAHGEPRAVLDLCGVTQRLTGGPPP